MVWTARALCTDGFVVSATVEASSEESAWAQVAGLARISGRESVTEFAELMDEPTLFA